MFPLQISPASPGWVEFKIQTYYANKAKALPKGYRERLLHPNISECPSSCAVTFAAGLRTLRVRFEQMQLPGVGIVLVSLVPGHRQGGMSPERALWEVGMGFQSLLDGCPSHGAKPFSTRRNFPWDGAPWDRRMGVQLWVLE